MEVGIAIGEMHRFELREALLIYTENRNGAFITRHGVTAQEAGPPTLGPAQPLTMAFVESLVRSIGGEARAEVLPEKVLARTDRMLCWWTPPRQRQMFYNNAEGKCGALNGKVFLQPALVWRVSDGGLSLRALTTNAGGYEACRRTLLEYVGRWFGVYRNHAASYRPVDRHDRSLGAWLLRE
jgi:PRTRC genetic system protein B